MPRYKHKPDPISPAGDRWWFILTNGRYYWRPEGKGYTDNILEAGLFEMPKAHTDRVEDKAIPLSEMMPKIEDELKICRDRIQFGITMQNAYREQFHKDK